MELVGEEEQEVVLVNFELVAWMIDFGPLGDSFQVYNLFKISF